MLARDSLPEGGTDLVTLKFEISIAVVLMMVEYSLHTVRSGDEPIHDTPGQRVLTILLGRRVNRWGTHSGVAPGRVAACLRSELKMGATYDFTHFGCRLLFEGTSKVVVGDGWGSNKR